MKGSAFIQKLAIAYIIIWTISPPLSIDTIWRLIGLGAAGFWLLLAMKRGFRFGRIHVFAIVFALGVVIIAIIETHSFGGILRQISLFLLVVFFLMDAFYEDKWEELSGLVPIVIALLFFFNVRTAAVVIANPTVARAIVRNDAATYALLRRGVGGYGLIYAQVVIFPALLAWVRATFFRRGILRWLGVAWLVSYLVLIANAGYSIAVVTTLIGTVLLVFYRGTNIVPTLFAIITIILGALAALLYWDGFRDAMLSFFEGTAVTKKINDLVYSAQQGEAEGSIAVRMDRYLNSLDAILTYPIIGGLWMRSGGGHSAVLDGFAKYGLAGGYMFSKMLFSVSNQYRQENNATPVRRIANATLATTIIVAALDTTPYDMIAMLLLVQPLLYEDIQRWSVQKVEGERHRKLRVVIRWRSRPTQWRRY